jgi:hypothetical protein
VVEVEVRLDAPDVALAAGYTHLQVEVAIERTADPAPGAGRAAGGGR